MFVERLEPVLVLSPARGHPRQAPGEAVGLLCGAHPEIFSS